jgi:hypothetical protein
MTRVFASPGRRRSVFLRDDNGLGARALACARRSKGLDLRHSTPLICPSGCFANGVSSLARKDIWLSSELKSLLCLTPSCPDERGVRVVTDVGCGMRWTRRCARTKRACPRTAKPCGPDAPTLASSWRRCRRITQVMSPTHHADDGGNKARSPRRARNKP